MTAAVTRAAAEDLAAVSPAAATTPWRDGFAALDVESLASDDAVAVAVAEADVRAAAGRADGGGGRRRRGGGGANAASRTWSRCSAARAVEKDRSDPHSYRARSMYCTLYCMYRVL